MNKLIRLCVVVLLVTAAVAQYSGGNKGSGSSSSNLANNNVWTGTNQYNLGITTGTGSGVAGYFFSINGTAPTLTANSFGLFAPTTITTAYGYQMPSAECAAAGFFALSAPTAHVNTVSCGTFSGNTTVMQTAAADVHAASAGVALCADGSGNSTTSGCSGAAVSGNFYQAWAYGASSTTGPAVNTTLLFGFVPPLTVTTSTAVVIDLKTADNTANLYNFAIFNSSGNIVCQTGAIAGTAFAASTGVKNVAWTAGCTVTGGSKLYFGYTSNCAASCLVLGSAGATNLTFAGGVAPTSNSATASAVWTTPIGIPADGFTSSVLTPGLGYHN